MDVKDYNSVQAEILNNLYANHKVKNSNGANVELPFGEKTVATVLVDGLTSEDYYNGDVEGTAVILTSPNGTRFNITVGDDGVLTATAITE